MWHHTPNDARFQLIAEYDLLGESADGGLINAAEWMSERLYSAQDRGAIVDHAVLNATPGIFGLQKITFTVELFMGVYDTHKIQRRKAAKILNEIVEDTDVNVRAIARA